MNDVFLPYRIVAQYADGSRLIFDGFTMEQARDAANTAILATGIP